jgi:hypothetical protein
MTLHHPVNSLVPDAALSSVGSRKHVLAAWAASIMAVPNLRVPNSLIFGSSCFLCAPFIFRTASGVLTGISRRARCALRASWACHWGWSRLAPSHK